MLLEYILFSDKRNKMLTGYKIVHVAAHTVPAYSYRRKFTVKDKAPKTPKAPKPKKPRAAKPRTKRAPEVKRQSASPLYALAQDQLAGGY